MKITNPMKWAHAVSHAAKNKDWNKVQKLTIELHRLLVEKTWILKDGDLESLRSAYLGVLCLQQVESNQLAAKISLLKQQCDTQLAYAQSTNWE